MIKKLTALVFSCIITVGLVAAASPTVDINQPTRSKVDVAIDNCRLAYASFRYGGDENEMFFKIREAYPEDERVVLDLICHAYQVGFEDGVEGVS